MYMEEALHYVSSEMFVYFSGMILMNFNKNAFSVFIISDPYWYKSNGEDHMIEFI